MSQSGGNQVEINQNQGFFTSTLDALVGWARKNSLWPLPFGTACCAIEYMATLGAHFDIARFGAEAVRFSPRQSDVMVVAGTVTDKMRPVMRKIYDQMLEPKWVIAMGVCASSGGFYRAYHVMQGIDEEIPVDVYVPGCPPTPEGFIHALMRIQDLAMHGKANQPREGFTLSIEEKMKQMQDDFPKELGAFHGAIAGREGEQANAGGGLYRALKDKLGGDLIGSTEFRGDLAVTIKKERLLEIAGWLKKTMNFDSLVDLTAADYMGNDPRFETIYHFQSRQSNKRLRVKCPVSEKDAKVQSLVSLWRGANWFEREVWDMYGIEFEGHPNCTERILTHADFKGHALRRDYDPSRRHVLKASIGMD